VARAAERTRWTVCCIALSALLAGCSDSSAPSQKAIVPTPVDPATAGAIVVDVTFEGRAPAPKLLDMRSAAQCAAAHSEPVYDETVLAPDGHLANAVVWIKDGLPSWVFAPPTQPITVDQRGCMYRPRVAAAMVGQSVQFVNSDPEPHNVHGHPQVVQAWNFIISRQGASRTLSFDKPEIAVPMGCDIHPWMRGYVAVLPNPFFAVTPSTGAVTLSQVPPGQYVIAVWHEKLGTKEQSITLPPSGKATLQVSFADNG